MEQPYKFKAWQPYEGYQTIAIADDFEAIMWGLEHQVDIFTQDDKLVYSPNDDEEYNFERLTKYGVRCVDDSNGRRWERIDCDERTAFMKVYRMNDCDWVAAESEEAAKKFYEQIIDREEIEEHFDGEVSLNELMWVDEEDVPEDERHKFVQEELAGKPVCFVPFSWVIKQREITEPCIIASTEY